MRLGSLAALLLIGSLAALPALATVYYVDQAHPAASDSNPGTAAAPWLTIQHAADTLVAGDTVYIRTGVYPEMVTPQSSGSAGSLITFAAYPGDTPTLDGTGITLPEFTGLFNIGAASYIRVSGLRAVNSDQSGILADGASHVTIDGCSTSYTASSGIGVWGCDNVLVDGNLVEHACTGIWNECISVGGCDTFTVSNNEVVDCHKEGICLKDGSTNGQVFGNEVNRAAAVGIYVDAEFHYTSGIDVFGNVVHHGSDAAFSLASEAGTWVLQNVRVYNNVAYDNGIFGLVFSNCCVGTTHPLYDITVVNNTFANNGVDWGGGISVDSPDIQNVVVRNNIVSQNLSFQIVVSAGVPAAELTVDHNLVDGFRGYEGEIYGDAAVEGDPRFVSVAGADFHLQADSPAVDQGSPDLAPAVDLDGTPRPQGLGFDIGAFELGGALFADGFESGDTGAWSAALP